MELETGAIKRGLPIATLIMGLVAGILLGTMVTPIAENTAEPEEYITTADLNRHDLGNVVTLSRFCEGLGFRSGVKWVRDEQGNVYGLPVCLQGD